MKKSLFYEQLVKEVKEDWQHRRELRRPYELTWQLNMNFVAGNQYADVSPLGVLTQQDKDYYWQQKQVFNHIAPIVETRMARLGNVRPKMLVRPFSNSQRDIESAKLATKVLNYVAEKQNLDALLAEATAWSEVCGTAFYKVVWNGKKGDKIALGNKSAQTGDVEIVVCSPFEIYPDSNAAANICQCGSIIHAKAYSTDDVKRLWGVDVKGERIRTLCPSVSAITAGKNYNATAYSITEEEKDNSVVVIERYVAPTQAHPNGELTIVAGDKFLYHGELPYANGENGECGFPFVRQTSHKTVGCFWGTSVVERLIPIQRCYNAVKNRKHEFLNRISMGVLTVEDGSVDTDNLEEEGLQPGKVLIYRSGYGKPSLLDAGNVPADFSYEEDRLLNEFIVVSGVSELARNSHAPVQVSSGTALQLLIEQDETRLASTADEIRDAAKTIGKQCLRLYKQYATAVRLIKTVCEDGSVQMHYFTAGDLSSDDIVHETENRLTDSVANRRSIVGELLKMGLFNDEQGNLSSAAKVKVLSMMGLGNWEAAQDLSQLHKAKADRENTELKKDETPQVIDNHALHIDSHVAYCVSGEAQKAGRLQLLLNHIALHKAYLREEEGQ